MPRRKKIKLEDLKKKRLSAIVESFNEPIVDDVQDEDISLIIDDIKVKTERNEFEGDLTSSTLSTDEYIFKVEKNELQKEIDSFENPIILEMPEFLTNPNLEDERKEVIEKLKYLLKRRFSLVTIADILETNDYSRLDEIIERKDETYKAVEKYTSEDGEKKGIRLFAGFKKIVGDEYSRTYVEQEERMKSALKILSEGAYFESAKKEKEKVEEYIEDIIARVIDDPEFNLACQIETEFVQNELKKAYRVLGELRSRSELKELVDELRETSKIAGTRAHAYEVMDRLITGKKREIITDKNDSQEGR